MERILTAIWAALRAFLQGVGRAIRQLFHEVTGAFFALFTMIGAVGIWREWHEGGRGWVLAVSLGFTLMMGFFALTSFRNARRVR